MRIIGEVENPMVNDKLWKQEKEVVDECQGCMVDVFVGEEVYEFTSLTGETVLVHQNAGCCQQYVGAISYCKIAGE